MEKIVIVFCLQIISLLSMAQQMSATGFQIIEQKEKEQAEVLWNGKLMTAYCFYDSIKKPFLFPLNTVDGITVTRGYPINPRPGERTDHPHHTGMWMDYESVNGLDFWNNSTAIAPEKRNLYGTIRHEAIVSKKEGKDNASLTATANWIRPDGHILIKEKTIYDFRVSGNQFIIDRTSTLTATGQEVVFKDVKDGFVAVRVARELEMPSDQADVFVDAHGNKTTVAKASNEGVTGMYYNSEGIKGDSVWSSKGRWAILQGQREKKQITIAIFDHPANVGYPTYWHARGYGLFAANPLGRKVFSNGKEELHFSLKPNTSTTFRYRLLISSGGPLSSQDLNKIADEFATKK